jgi:hypothetical protein
VAGYPALKDAVTLLRESSRLESGGRCFKPASGISWPDPLRIATDRGTGYTEIAEELTRTATNMSDFRNKHFDRSAREESQEENLWKQKGLIHSDIRELKRRIQNLDQGYEHMIRLCSSSVWANSSHARSAISKVSVAPEVTYCASISEGYIFYLRYRREKPNAQSKPFIKPLHR